MLSEWLNEEKRRKLDISTRAEKSKAKMMGGWKDTIISY